MTFSLYQPGKSGNATTKLSELIGALSHALDLTEGQPEGRDQSRSSRSARSSCHPPTQRSG